MTSLGGTLQATALRLLKQYSSVSVSGLTTTVTRATAGTYDTTTSETAADTVTTYTGYGHAEPYSITEQTNSTVAATDLKFLFYSTTRPKVDDVIAYDSRSYRVMAVDITNVNGLDVVYTLQLRV